MLEDFPVFTLTRKDESMAKKKKKATPIRKYAKIEKKDQILFQRCFDTPSCGIQNAKQQFRVYEAKGKIKYRLLGNTLQKGIHNKIHCLVLEVYVKFCTELQVQNYSQLAIQVNRCFSSM